jgi:7-carboxy-7-deazaguanine synthase
MSSETSSASAERLRITEIFHSLQGEARTVGWPTVFVRLTGCPLRCVWCDTEYSFHGGEWREISDIVEEVKKYKTRHVCVTGGEPLAQKRCLDLLRRLCDEGLDVSLETSGALDVSLVDARVSRVVDVKAPGSGESAQPVGQSRRARHARPDQVRARRPRRLRLGAGRARPA